MALKAAGDGEELGAFDGFGVVGEALRLGPHRHQHDRLRGERLLRGRASVRQRPHRDHDDDRRDDRHRPPAQPALTAEVDERQGDRDPEQDVRDSDRAEHDRVRPFEDPEQVEEEVEVPVRPRHEVRRARVGLLGVVRPQQARILRAVGGEVPDAGEADDHEDDEQAHHRVVEHRVGEERLPGALDVLLVALVLGAARLDAPTRHRSLRGHPAGRGPLGRPPAPAARHGRARQPRPTTAAKRHQADHEVEVQDDQPDDRAGDHEHVQRVELAERVGADLGASR